MAWRRTNFYELDPARQKAASARRLLAFVREEVARYHPFLRKYYRDAGIDPATLRGPADLNRLPLLDKSQLQSDPQAFILQPHSADGPAPPAGYSTEPLRGSVLLRYAIQALLGWPPDPSELVRQPSFRERVRRRALQEWLPIHFHVSTGSTGQPTPVMYTYRDFQRNVRELAALLIRTKGGPEGFDWTDRTMNVFPGAPHVAFFAPVLAKALVGVQSFETFGGGVIPTDRQIQLFARGGFNSLTAIPSYLVHWLRRAAVLLEQGQIEPLRQFRRALVGAEPLSEPLRRAIRELALAVGADPSFTLYQTYGLTELKWTSWECAEGSGTHLNPKHFYWEILDPVTRQPVGPREPGVLVFSHIDWRGTVLIRYWTGDLAKGGMSWERCPHCGYVFPRVHPPICRAEKDFTKLKGARVDLSLLVETVRDLPGVRLFQVVLDSEDPALEFSRDLLIVHIVPAAGVERAVLEHRLRERLKAVLEVTPDRVVFEDDEAALEKKLFARTQVKADYLIERRKHHL